MALVRMITKHKGTVGVSDWMPETEINKFLQDFANNALQFWIDGRMKELKKFRPYGVFPEGQDGTVVVFFHPHREENGAAAGDKPAAKRRGWGGRR